MGWKEKRFFCTPVLRTLLTAGGVELIESPDRPCSISVVPGGDKDGGLTEDSWTYQKKKERKKLLKFTWKDIQILSLIVPTDTFFKQKFLFKSQLINT